MTFFAFVLNRPIVLMCRLRPSSPSVEHLLRAWSTVLNSSRVAMLTPASVAWADRTTATSRV